MYMCKSRKYTTLHAVAYLWQLPLIIRPDVYQCLLLMTSVYNLKWGLINLTFGYQPSAVIHTMYSLRSVMNILITT